MLEARGPRVDPFVKGDIVMLTGKDWEQDGMRDRIVQVQNPVSGGIPWFYSWVPLVEYDLEGGGDVISYIYENSRNDYSATLLYRPEVNDA